MSQVFDLGEFKSPAKLNTRTVSAAREQKFRLKYRETKFIFSNKLWKELNLDEQSLKILIHPTTSQVILVQVGNDEGDIVKKTPKTGLQKGKTFKSSVLADALAKTGLLDLQKEGNQFLDVEEGATATGDKVYAIVAGTVSEEAAKEEEEADAAETVTDTVEPQVESSQVASQAEVPAQAPSSDDLLGGAKFEDNF